jgi:hypothetical protein
MIGSMSGLPINPVGRRAEKSPPELPQASRIFLLSPANVAGIRAGLIMNENHDSVMARRLRQDGVSLGELFSS